MTPAIPRPADADALFVQVMHRFAEVFEDHAILKGGMALRLVDSPRSTTDIDYVLVPFASKKDVATRVEAVLREIEGAEVRVKLHSKMLRADVILDAASIQVEVNVAPSCPSTPMATGAFARAHGHPSRVIRVMSWDHALAHKLAAWNERRLLRDLYDCYFLATRLGATPDLDALDARLTRIESRLPELRRRRRMSRAEFTAELRDAALRLDEDALRHEVAPLLPPDELPGLDARIRAAAIRLAERIETE